MEWNGQHNAGAAFFLKYEEREEGQGQGGVEQSSGLEAYLASEAHGVHQCWCCFCGAALGSKHPVLLEDGFS